MRVCMSTHIDTAPTFRRKKKVKFIKKKKKVKFIKAQVQKASS